MKKSLPLFSLILLCSFSIHSLSAQDSPQWVNCTSGLQINDLLKTATSHWIATDGGLLKEDLATGQQIYYTRGNSPIPSNKVNSLALDKEGILWGSTNLGTFRFDGLQWDLFYEKSGLLSIDHMQRIVLAEQDSLHWWDGSLFNSIALPDQLQYLFMSDFICHPEKEELWITAYTFGFFSVEHFDGQTWTSYNNSNSIMPFESPTNNPLHIDAQGRTWLGTGNGLYRFDGGNWTYFDPAVSTFPAGAISGFHQIDNENLFILIDKNYFSSTLTASLILEINTNDEWSTQELPEALEKAALKLIRINSDDQIRIGTQQDGLWLLDQQNWIQQNTSQSFLKSNNISQILIDDQERWVLNIGQGDKNNGLFHYDNNSWQNFMPADLPEKAIPFNNSTQLLTYWPEDRFWFYSQHQLFIYDDQTWTTPILPDVSVDVDENNSIIHFDQTNSLWVFDKSSSFIFNQVGNDWISHDPDDHGAISGTFENIYTHPVTGDLYFSSVNGFSHFDGLQWHFFKAKDFGQTVNQIYDLVQLNNDIIVSTYKGLYSYDGTTLHPLTDVNSPLPNPNTRGLTVDDQGRLWVGLYAALAVYDGTSWEVFTNKNSGIPNGSIDELAFDEEGNLWIGSDHGGLAFYNPEGVTLNFEESFHTNTQNLSVTSRATVSVYPNPLKDSDTLTLQFSEDFDPQEKVIIELYNTAGQKIDSREQTLNNRMISIKLPQVLKSSGVYYIQVYNKRISASTVVSW